MDNIFNNIYGIATMSDNYDKRCVANDKRANFTLDTALVTDRDWLYETAVHHRCFNDDCWIILDGCDTIEEAREIHQKWLDFLETDSYDNLKDYFNGQSYRRELH